MTITPLVSHPIANAYPSMTDGEYTALRESVKKNGVRNPIIIYEGMILDGRHRYLACKELGIEPPTLEFEGDACPVEYVRDINSNRRSLTPSQRAAVAVALLPLIEIEAKKRQGRKQDEVSQQETTGKSSEIAAKATGASARMVDRAKKVAKKKPELVEKVKTGEITIGEAEAEIESEEIASNANATDVFNGEEWGNIDRALLAIAKDIRSLSSTEAGKFLAMTQIEAAIKDARNAVKFARPHCACPMCEQVKNDHCGVCKGGGWITKPMNERLPKELQK